MSSEASMCCASGVSELLPFVSYRVRRLGLGLVVCGAFGVSRGAFDVYCGAFGVFCLAKNIFMIYNIFKPSRVVGSWPLRVKYSWRTSGILPGVFFSPDPWAPVTATPFSFSLV